MSCLYVSLACCNGHRLLAPIQQFAMHMVNSHRKPLAVTATLCMTQYILCAFGASKSHVNITDSSHSKKPRHPDLHSDKICGVFLLTCLRSDTLGAFSSNLAKSCVAMDFTLFRLTASFAFTSWFPEFVPRFKKLEDFNQPGTKRGQTFIF